MMGFIVCVCYFFMTIVDISTSAKDGKLVCCWENFPDALLQASDLSRFQASTTTFFNENFLLKLLDLELFPWKTKTWKKCERKNDDEVAEMSRRGDILRTISVVAFTWHFFAPWKFFSLKASSWQVLWQTFFKCL